MASIDDRWTTPGPNGKRARTDRWGQGKRYRARWREFPGGPQKTEHFDRKLDAERFLTDVQHRILTGSYTPPEAGLMTVADYAAEWQGRRSWAPATAERIDREFRLYIVPKLGQRPLSSIRRAHVEEWAKALPLAPSSARMVYETLSNMLAAAVDDERIPRNPAKGARLAKSDVVPFVPLTADQVRTIAHTMAEHVRCAVLLAAGTGLRQGEIFGLTVDRVDFLRRELRVDRQLFTPGRGAPFLKAPKSANSYRTVPLSTLVVDALAVHLETFGSGGCAGEERSSGLVFHTGGRPIGRAMASKHIRTAVAAAGLEGHAWHDLRHHHASSLLSEGVNPTKVAERLGHDVKTLLTTYAHVMPKDDDRVRSIIDATLGTAPAEWLRAAGADRAEDRLRTGQAGAMSERRVTAGHA